MKKMGGSTNTLTAWKSSCNELEVYTQKRPNNIRQYKACPKQTFLWIVEYVLNKNIHNNQIVVNVDKHARNGLYARLIINELLKNNITIDQKSSKLWRHIQNLNQSEINIVKTHNGQMDVVKGLWDEISKVSTDIIKSRLEEVGIPNV